MTQSLQSARSDPAYCVERPCRCRLQTADASSVRSPPCAQARSPLFLSGSSSHHPFAHRPHHSASSSTWIPSSCLPVFHPTSNLFWCRYCPCVILTDKASLYIDVKRIDCPHNPYRMRYPMVSLFKLEPTSTCSKRYSNTCVVTVYVCMGLIKS